MILVTGASGQVGGAVLAKLLASGQKVRALYRSQKDAQQAPQAANAAIGDFADKESLRRAMKGVDSVFLVCGPIRELVELESNVVEVAKELGIKRLVKNSAMGAGTFDSSFPRWHRQVEKVIETSGVPYTFVRPNSFMQNIVNYNAPTIRTQNAFYAALNDAKISYIDVNDIGEVIAKTLTTSGHDGKTYELNGPDAVSSADLAARISRLVGHEVRYVNLTPDALRGGMLSTGMPAWQADALVDLQRYYTEGRGGDVDNVVANIIGRPPKKLDQFLAENVAAFRASSAVA